MIIRLTRADGPNCRELGFSYIVTTRPNKKQQNLVNIILFGWLVTVYKDVL